MAVTDTTVQAPASREEEAQEQTTAGRSLRQIVFARLRRDKVAMLCLIVLIVMYLIAIVPIILGDGERLFDEVGPGPKLELVRTIAAPGVTHVRYRIDRK